MIRLRNRNADDFVRRDGEQVVGRVVRNGGSDGVQARGSVDESGYGVSRSILRMPHVHFLVVNSHHLSPNRSVAGQRNFDEFVLESLI